MQILVYLDSTNQSEPILIGTLYADVLKGKDVFSFEYAESWLRNKNCRLLDPDLQLFSGRQYLTDDKSNFGIFLDSTPDHWGRLLLDRREALRAKVECRNIRSLREMDYLLGVFDGSRMGALRFKTEENGPFLDNETEMASPPWTSLRELERASWELERDEENSNNKWLQMLVKPGSSLGGARPKANVYDENGQLWIAKFPSRSDRRDVGAWEMVCMTLAKQCGIEVSTCQTEILGVNGYHTFLTKRFDRSGIGQRIHFISAITALGYKDGASSSNGVSYLELAEWIQSNCKDVNANLLELYKRIVFNIAVSNCDDHLRNHGFIYADNGWKLSPAYDINPDEYGVGLSLNINETSNALDFGLACEIAPYFGLGDGEKIISEMCEIIKNWRYIASSLHISRDEQERYAHCFNV